MQLGELIRSGTKWLLAGRVGNQLLQFVFGVVLARLLVPADFGMLVTVQVFTGLAGFVAGGGMGEALIRAKQAEERDFQVVFTIQLAICALIYAFFFSIAPWFAIWFDEPLYEDLLRISALSFMLRPFTSIPRSMLSREMRFKAVAMAEMATMLSTGVASVLMALSGYGVWSLVWGGLLGSLLNALILVYHTRWKPRPLFDAQVGRTFGIVGVKFSINHILDYLRMQVGNLIVSRILGPAATGLYNKAISLNAMPINMIGGSAFQTVFRAISSEQDNLDKAKYMYLRMMTLVSVYALPFYVGLWWLAKSFIVVIYGEKWADSADVLVIIVIIGLFQCLTFPAGALVAALNALGKEIVIQIEVLVLLVAGGLYGVQWGIQGVAWAAIGVGLYQAFRMSLLANSCVGARYRELFKAVRPALLLNGILFLTLMLADFIIFGRHFADDSMGYLIGMGGVGVITYTLAFLFIPIEALDAEVMRWKKTLRIAPVTAGKAD